MRFFYLIMMLIALPALADPPPTKSKLEIDPQTVEEAQFYNVLIRITRCTTVEGQTCSFDIFTAEDLLYYFTFCLRLNKWHLTYTFPSRSSLNIMITKDLKVKKSCLITVTDTANHVQQQCLIDKDQLSALVKSSSLPVFFANFNNDPDYGRQFDDPLLQQFNTCLTSNPH